MLAWWVCRGGFWRLAALTSVGVLAGCTHGPPPCVAGLSLDCRPLYDPPIFQTLFDQTFHPTCATGTTTCHTPEGAKKGLVFQDADDAYALLLAPRDADPRVLPADPACSTLMIRLSSTDPGYRMPPGPTPLSAAALCAVAQWIAAGAAR